MSMKYQCVHDSIWKHFSLTVLRFVEYKLTVFAYLRKKKRRRKQLLVMKSMDIKIKIVHELILEKFPFFSFISTLSSL